MSQSRFNAIDNILTRSVSEFTEVKNSGEKISSYFGSLVFNDAKMREYLTEKAYKNVREAIDSGAKISRKDADIVAEAMKRWAMEKEPLTLPTGSSLLQEGLLRSTILSLRSNRMEEYSKNSVEMNWLNKNRMAPVSRVVVFGLPLKPGVIPHGTPPLLLLSLK